MRLKVVQRGGIAVLSFLQVRFKCPFIDSIQSAVQ